MLDRADCADFGCHNSIRLETKHFLNTLALTFISFSGRFVFAMQKHYLFFVSDPLGFFALIHPIQWTIANPVGADRPAKRQKKTSCVATSRPVPVLCIPQMAPRTSFLSRHPDVIASFSFGACSV